MYEIFFHFRNYLKHATIHMGILKDVGKYFLILKRLSSVCSLLNLASAASRMFV